MRKDNDNWLKLQRLRGNTWLPLLALACFQVTLASHQFDHVDEYTDESCEICVQLDRADDNAVDLSPGKTAPEPALFDALRHRPSLVERSTDRGYDSRAPPNL